MRFKAVILSVIVILILFASSAMAQEEEEPIYWEADYIEYLREEGIIVAIGNVKMTQKYTVLKADLIKMNIKTGETVAEGHASLWDGIREISGTSVIYNTKTKKGEIKKVAGFPGSTYADPWYFKGKKMIKLEEDKYKLTRATFTTCDLPSPHYHFWAHPAYVRLEDRIWLYNAVFFLGKMPLAYLPFYTRSLTGVPYGWVIVPEYDNKRGMTVKSRYNFYFRPKAWRRVYRSRGTLYGDYLGRAGWGKGLGYKYTISRKGKDVGSGALYGYHIKEHEIKKFDDGKFYREPGAVTERWKGQLRYSHTLTKYTNATAYVDYVSVDKFNRKFDLEARERVTRELDYYGAVTRTKPRYYMRGVGHLKESWDSSTEKFGKQEMRLPELTLGSSYINIGRLPLYYKGKVQATSLYTKAQGFTGWKGDLTQHLTTPINLGPRMGASVTGGYTEHLYEQKSKYNEDGVAWGTYEGIGRLNTRITRYLQNDIVYKYSQNIHEPTDVSFDPGTGVSQVEPAFRLQLPPKRLKVKLSTRYDFKKEEKHWDKIRLDLNLWPAKWLEYDLDAGYSIGGVNKMTNLGNRFEIVPNRYTSFYFGHRFTHGSDADGIPNDVQDLFSGARFWLDRKKKWKLTVSNRFRQDPLDHGFELRDVGVELWRDLHAWEMTFSYRYKERAYLELEEHKVWVQFNIKELSGFKVGQQHSLRKDIERGKEMGAF
ncbi:MAG TPA: LPS-assembly protein LptD [bacterium]|nr:LPS-assembly protein LptD [bacterium]